MQKEEGKEMEGKRKGIGKRILAFVLTCVMVLELGLTPVANTQAMQVDRSIEKQGTSVQENSSESTEATAETTEVTTENVQENTSEEENSSESTSTAEQGTSQKSTEATTVTSTEVTTEATTEAEVIPETGLVSDENLITLDNKDFETKFNVTKQWDNQFEAEVVITNTSDKVIENWNVTCTFTHEITQVWNAFVFGHKGDKYQFKNADWNADIAPGASVSFSFTANWDNTTINEPTNFELSSEQIKISGDNYNAEFTVTSDWGDGFNGSIKITNNTDKVINDWVLSFDFDHTIDNVWNGQLVEHTENHYIIKNSGYNGKLTKGQSIEIGFQGKPGNVQSGPYNYELLSYEDLKLELEPPVLILDGTGEYPVLKWNQVDGSTTYTVKRKTSENGTYEVLATDLAENTYTDISTGAKGEYYYVVTADNKFTSSLDSNEVCYRNIAKTPTLYGKVENETIELIWTEALGARSYTVYRSTQSGGPYYVIADNLLKTEYVDEDLDPDEIYYYVVVAENERGSSENSNEVRLGVNEEREYTFDGDADDDGDGLINSDELLAGTDIFSKDTDNDGLDDKQEAKKETNPLEPDTDGDGIYDGAEVLLGTDPFTETPMGEYTIDETSDSGRANVFVKGDSNFVIAPFGVNDTENVLINSLTGIVGNGVEFTTGGFSFDNAEMTFYYTDEELEQLGISEDTLGVFKVNFETKQLEPLQDITIDKEKNTITVSVTNTGTFIMGFSEMSIDLSNVDIVFAIDQSGSMDWNDPDFYRILATQKFIEKLDMDEYQAGILAFTDVSTVKCSITGDADKLEATLNKMKTCGGGTDLASAINGSVNMFKDNSRRKIVILLTDGVGGNPVPTAADKCVKNNVVVNTIALGSDTDTKVLQNIATYTKGGYFYINNSSDMTKEDVEKQIDLIYEKLSKQLTLSEEAEDEDLPEGKMNLEFSDLHNGIDSREAQEWITTASTNLLTGNYVYDETDIEMLGNGNNLVFTRTYNSLSADEDSILGKGYRTNLDTKVEKKESSSGDQIQVGKVDTGRLNVRAGAGTDQKIIGGLTRGKTIKVLATEEVNNQLWYKIDYKGKDGYVASWYIDGNGGYEVTFATGTKIFFTENKDGSIRANNSTDATFIKKATGGYKVKNADLSVLEYDKKGNLIAMYDRNSNKITVEYKDDKVSKLSDVFGRSLKLTYGDNGLLSSITDHVDRQVSYKYNSKKQLTEVVDMMGNSTKYTYHEKTGLLTKVTDPKGNQIVRNDYDALGRIVRQYDSNDIIQYFIYDDEIDEKSEGVSARYMINGNGKESKTTFNQDLKPVIERDALGGETKYKYEYYNGDTKKWVNITTKRDGNKVWEEYEEYKRNNKIKTRETVTDKNGHKTVTTYNKKGSPTQVKDAKGNIAKMKYDSYGNLIYEEDKAGNVTEYVYDSKGINLVKKIEPGNKCTEYEYYKKTATNGIKLKGLLKKETNSRNGVTKYSYDKKYNNCTKIEQPYGIVTKMTYSSLGRKKTETDGYGNVTKYTYDKMGHVKTITDPFGYQIKYTYDKNGNKLSETDKKGRKTKYSYDNKNQLVKVTDALKNETKYTYDHVGNLIKETNAKGSTRYTYDAVNRKTVVEDALGNETHYVYDANGNVEQEIDALGRVTTYTYTKLNQVKTKTEPLGKETTYAYDKVGNLTKEADSFKNYTKSTYDAYGRVTEYRDKNGNITKTVYDDINGTITQTAANGAVTVTELDQLYREKKVIYDNGTCIEKEYDTNGNLCKEIDELKRVTLYTYNKFNLVASKNVQYKEKENGEDVVKDCITTYVYDKNGNKVSEKNAMEQTTSWTYDKLNRVKREINAEGGYVEYTYDAVGNVTAVKDEMGRISSKIYDALSRVIEEKDPLGNVTQYSYDEVGNLKEEINALNSKTTYEYDELNRNTAIIDNNGNRVVMAYDAVDNNTAKQDKNGNVTKYEYYPNGQLKKTINPDKTTICYEYDEMGNQTKVYDAYNNYTETVYDKLGRKQYYYDQNRNVEQYIYDEVGNLKEVINFNEESTQYEYDDFDQLIKVTDAVGNVTTYTYDLAGNMKSQTDGEGRTVSYNYDDMNRVTTMTDAAGKTEIYTYNEASKMIGKIDRNKVVFSYTYDDNDQLLTETSGSMVYNYTYDALGNMKTMTDKTGTTTFEYDNMSQLIKKVFPTKDVVSYTYDAQGNQKSIQSGTNHKVEYLYDNMNRLETVAWDGGTTQYKYDKNGNQSEIIHSNGMKSSYTFDGRNLLTGIVNHNPDGTKQEYSYTYDAEGLLTEKVEPKGKTTYTYTEIQQLDTMTEPNGRVTTYTYDKAGNRKSQLVVLGDSKTTVDYTYNNQNRLTDTVENRDGTIIKTIYTYDANGNQTEVSEKNEATGETAVDKYKYDELNQLIRIEGRDGSKSEYTYYGTGLRASKNVNNSTAVFIYDGKEILAETTAQGTKTNIFGNNMIATTGTDTLYYQYNNHGDVVGVLDESGTLKNEYDYDAFGNAITEKETVKNPYRYAGYYQDTESGLYYLRSRYYNPKTARFLTEDTASGKYTDPLSLNKYTYCHNQPVTGYDPDGYALNLVAGAIGAAAGALIGGAFSYATQAWKNKSFTEGIDWKQVVGGAAEGAIVGGAAGLTFGGSLLATAGGAAVKTGAKIGAKAIAKQVATRAAAGAVAGFTGNSANQLISNGASNYDVTEAITAGVATSASFMAAGAFESTAQNVGSKVASKTLDLMTKKAGCAEALSAGAKIGCDILGASASAGFLGGISGGAGDIAYQATNIKSGIQESYNPVQTLASTAISGTIAAAAGGTSKALSYTKLGGMSSGTHSGKSSVMVGDNKQSVVYRVIRGDENPLNGLTAKNPTRGMSIEGHVTSGSRNKGSQFISTTTDINVANKYAMKDGCRIVEINLSKLPSDVSIYDLSTVAGRSTHLKGVTARNFAAKSSEVLLEGYIPSDAITLH